MNRNRLTILITLAGLLGAILLIGQIRRTYAAGLDNPPPPPKQDVEIGTQAKTANQKATQAGQDAEAQAVFAGGCFWCTEAVFEQLKGVDQVVSGFAGGESDTAHYPLVARGNTDHAESIEITYDPEKITYGQLLRVFFGAAHDPTQRNRQGPDVGTQYRSVVFYDSPRQKKVAKAYIEQLDEAGIFDKPIVTQLTALDQFYPAVEHHQDFVKKHPDHPYVQAHALPKLAKVRKFFPDLVKAKK